MLKKILISTTFVLGAALTMAVISFGAIEASANKKEQQQKEVKDLLKTYQLEHKCSKSDSLELLKSQINVLTQKLYNCEYK